jgi:hypothetical protein
MDPSGIIPVSLFVGAPSYGASSRKANSHFSDKRGKRPVLPPTLATQEEAKPAPGDHEEGSTCLREAAFSLRSHFGEVGPAKAGEMLQLQYRRNRWHR